LGGKKKKKEKKKKKKQNPKTPFVGGGGGGGGCLLWGLKRRVERNRGEFNPVRVFLWLSTPSEGGKGEREGGEFLYSLQKTDGEKKRGGGKKRKKINRGK